MPSNKILLSYGNRVAHGRSSKGRIFHYHTEIGSKQERPARWYNSRDEWIQALGWPAAEIRLLVQGSNAPTKTFSQPPHPTALVIPPTPPSVTAAFLEPSPRARPTATSLNQKSMIEVKIKQAMAHIQTATNHLSDIRKLLKENVQTVS